MSVSLKQADQAAAVVDRPQAVAVAWRAHTGAGPHHGQAHAKEATARPCPHSLPSLALALYRSLSRPQQQSQALPSPLPSSAALARQPHHTTVQSILPTAPL